MLSCVSRRTLQRGSRVSRRTLQRDLRVMVDKGLIIEKSSSPTDPTKIYILAGKLSS
jgi:DNA-binding HxlR family transcriptional regulator